MRLMVVGIPNVGKSSLINAMRRTFSGKGNAATTGNRPGVTRNLQTDIKIHEFPPVYLVDTPGVMIPNLESGQVGMILSLIGTLRDELVGEELIADFLLYTLNSRRNFTYVKEFGLEAPSDDIEEVLHGIATKKGALLQGGVPNTDLAARYFVECYRLGKLGRFRL
eukprot:m.146370 g.146370  ORF g.146370 m.146370 type:complete len:166 (-) comp14969_c0_seq4:3297-3794(-)